MGVGSFFPKSLQWTPDNSNLQGKLKKSSTYREFEANHWKYGNKQIDGEGSNAIKQQSKREWTLNLNWRDKIVKTELTRFF